MFTKEIKVSLLLDRRNRKRENVGKRIQEADIARTQAFEEKLITRSLL
jgi:hypothetical protein